MTTRSRSLLVLVAGIITQGGAKFLPLVNPRPGSHYEVMRQVGEAMTDRMHLWVRTYHPLQTSLLPYTRTPEGAAVFKSLIDTNKKLFPNYWEELRGLADGSGIDLEIILHTQFRVELLRMPGTPGAARALAEVDQECSDVLASSSVGLSEAHNEDGGVQLRDTGYMVNATFLDASGAVESGYLAFHYPLSTAGHAFGVNIHGLHQSENSVTPVAPPKGGSVSAFFLARHVFDAKNFADAVSRSRLAGMPANFSVGASLNIGSFQEGIMGNIEVGPPHIDETGAHINVKVLKKNDAFFHFNMFLHTPGIEQVPQASSKSRLARAEELKRAAKRYDPDFVARVLSDTARKQLPLYRNGTEKVLTAGTGLFDHARHTFSVWWVRPIVPPGEDKPSVPDHHLDIRSRKYTPWISSSDVIVLYA